jgi:type III restriction enzyme
LTQVVIENPVINSPFDEPRRHFKFSDDGITDEILVGRRVSSYFMPVPGTKKKGKQLLIDTEWTQDRLEENRFINQVRGRVAQWRLGGHVGLTKTTAQLLAYWTRPNRERRLFFCQIEALETVIYLTEIAPKLGDAWIDNQLREANAASNPDLFRIAFKMATGSGKTVVMAMLIAWHVLNKLANPQDARFSDTFLIVTPGITIRDRLRVLLPNDPDNYYRKMDVVSAGQLAELHQAKVLITNFHGFLLRERASLSKVNKSMLAGWRPGQEGKATSPFTETPDQMVRRVCRELGNKRNIVVINDEAHHCYRRRPEPQVEKLSADDRREAKQREEEARVWISGLEAVKRKIGLRAV